MGGRDGVSGFFGKAIHESTPIHTNGKNKRNDAERQKTRKPENGKT